MTIRALPEKKMHEGEGGRQISIFGHRTNDYYFQQDSSNDLKFLKDHPRYF